MQHPIRRPRAAVLPGLVVAFAIASLLSSAGLAAHAQEPPLAQEGEAFKSDPPRRVRYGEGLRWVEKTVAGEARCDNAWFGSDPAPNVRKRCWSAPPDAQQRAAAISSRSRAPAPTDVLDANGRFDAVAYRALAARMSEAVGIAYRYGAPAQPGAADGKRATLHERPDQLTRCHADKSQCLSSWQVGGPRKDDQPGAYSTNQSSVLFVADDPGLRAGVGDLQASAFDANTYAQKPQLLWQNNGGGLDSVNVVQYRGQGLLPTDGSARPIAAGRCSGPPGFCPTSVIAFQNGVLATTGSNTAHNLASVQLPPNKIPTAVAMTNNSEYALVSVWDTSELKGQVAVLALAGLCDGCKPEGPFYEWWSEWRGAYPGLPNMGNIGYMKLLGYVDLPSEMKAPTEIAVTTGLHHFKTVLPGGDFMGRPNSPLAEHWRSFAPGGPNADRYAKGGVAVVISKSEKQAAFIDLAPLFRGINGMYFSPEVTRTSKVGPGARDWPFTFEAMPRARPVVAKTMALAARPTAVKTTISRAGNAHAWIATEDGKLRIASLGGYAPGEKERTPKPQDIALVGSVDIGRNATSLAHSKGEADPEFDALNGQVIVTSRAERKLQWVRFAADGKSGRVVRTLADARLVDPIAAEDIDNFANQGLTVGVADYTGRAIRNYRYGPAIFADRGPGFACQPPAGCPVKATGDVAIEYGGGFDMQGQPFQINTSNVP